MAFYCDNYTMSYAAGVSKPTSWTWRGSNNGVDWTILDTVAGYVWGAQTVNFTCDVAGSFQYFKINVTAVSTAGQKPRIADLYIRYGAVNVNADMTAADAPAPNVVSAGTDQGATYAPWKAFDYDIGTSWYSNTANADWLMLNTGVAPPLISSLTPDHAIVGATVTIAGTGFGANQGTSVVRFGGIAGAEAAITSWSDTEIVCTVPVGAATAGGCWVILTASYVTADKAFTVHPYISDLDPASGEPTDHFDINGYNFGAAKGASTVTLDGDACSTVNWSNTQIEAVVPAGATDGDVVVVVGGNASNAVAFDVLPNLALTSITPATAANDSVVYITDLAGAGFEAGATVKLTKAGEDDITATDVEVVTDIKITCTFSLPESTAAGDWTVVVTQGVTTASLVDAFAVTEEPLVVTGITPNYGYAGSAVTIDGTDFKPARTTGFVRFGSTNVVTYDSWSDAAIACTVPVGETAGTVSVMVQNSQGENDTINYALYPRITNLSSAAVYIGANVTIYGSSFGASQGASTVSVAGAAPTVVSWSPTAIEITLTEADAGDVFVTVNSRESNHVSLTVLTSAVLRYVNSDGTERLNIYDRDGYFLLESGFAYPPPTVAEPYIDSPLKDGQVPADFMKWNNRELSFAILVRGTSDADLRAKVRALMQEIHEQRNVVEWRPQLSDTPYYFNTFRGVNVDISPLFRHEYRAHKETVVRWSCQAEPFAYTAERSLKVFESLGVNDSFEAVSGGAPTGWIITTPVSGGYEVLVEGDELEVAFDRTNFLRLSAVTGGDSIEIQDADFIAVDATKPYNIKARCRGKGAGSPLLSVDVLEYDSDGDLLETQSILSAFETLARGYWLDEIELNHGGVIEASDWNAGTTKIKRRFTLENGTLDLDALYFGCSQYAVGERIQAAQGITIPAGTFEGDVPAPADVYIRAALVPFVDLFIGQRAGYSDDYAPVQLPQDGTAATDMATAHRRVLQTYRDYDIPSRLVANGDFATGDFTNWTASMYAGGKDTLEITTDYKYRGSYAVKSVYKIGAGVGPTFIVIDQTLITDPFAAADMDEIWSAAFYGRAVRSNYPEFDVTFFLDFYDAASVLLKRKHIYTGRMSNAWKRYGGYIQPSDFPDDTDTLALGFRRQGNFYFYAYGSPTVLAVQYYDCVLWSKGEAFGEVTFNAQDHEGKYLVNAGVAMNAPTPVDDSVTLQATAKHITHGYLSDYGAERESNFGDPNNNFVDTIRLNPNWKSIEVPSVKLAEAVDLSVIEQAFRVRLDPNFDDTKGFRIDAFTLIPVDRSYVAVRGFDGEYLILDGTSEQPAVLSSVDGTISSAQIYDRTKYNVAPAFRADPNGVNITYLALSEGFYTSDGEDMNLAVSVPDITIRYKPRYLVVP